MSNIYLKVPGIDELHYRQEWMKDAKTMSYNAGFDMENSNMAGHWIGIFTAKGNETQIDFTENVTPKKWIMKPFVKIYLKKQQEQFVLDLKKALE